MASTKRCLLQNHLLRALIIFLVLFIPSAQRIVIRKMMALRGPL